MSYLSRLKAATEKQPHGLPPKAPEPPFGVFGSSSKGRFHGLAPDLVEGLARLQLMARPKMAEPDNWVGIVADCLRIGEEGWAVQALGLGWSPEHLWGLSPAHGGNVDQEGLGIWLNGRRIVVLDAQACVVADDEHRRSVFTCRGMGGSVLIWELGGRA